jgi:hypothetical protein
MTWRLARSLETLRDEINAAAPTRSKASDGTIGDTAHSSRASDHNPNSAGVVRAMDVTDDKPTFSADALANAVAGLLGKHPALGSGAYVIWNWRIVSTDRLREGWRPYSGSNGHTKHVHISVATAASGYDSTAPWGVAEEDDMFSDEDRAMLRELLAEVKQMRQGQKQFRHNEVKRDGKTSDQLDRIEKQGK